MAWTSLFLQKEQVGIEQFCIQQSGSHIEGKSPGSEIYLCAGLAFGKPENTLIGGGRWEEGGSRGIVENASKALQSHSGI